MRIDWNAVREHWKHLKALPVDNPERQKLKDRVPGSAKSLERRTRKFLSLSPEFQRVNPVPLDKIPLPQGPRYPAASHGTRQSQPLPFESGTNTLPGMERFAR